MKRSVMGAWAGMLKIEEVDVNPFLVLISLYNIFKQKTDGERLNPDGSLPDKVVDWAGMDKNDIMLFKEKSSNQVLKIICKIREQRWKEKTLPQLSLYI